MNHATTLCAEWELNITWTRSTAQILEAIAHGTALTVSDGSYQHDQGACMWIIEGQNSLDRVNGFDANTWISRRPQLLQKQGGWVVWATPHPLVLLGGLSQTNRNTESSL